MLRLLSAFILVLLAGPGVAAQTPLTITSAMERARSVTPEARALEASRQEAVERERQARAGYWPSVDVTATAQRGNHPVFAFSSLLAQRRFTEANFAVHSLNRPDPVTNIRTFAGAQQSLWDGGRTRSAAAGARLNRESVAAETAAAGQDLALHAARAYVQVLRAEAIERAASAAVAAGEGDLERVRARREMGLVTPADLLAADVHLAEARERLIDARSALIVARLQLAAATGLPAGETLVLAAPEIPASAATLDSLVVLATEASPEMTRARLAVNSAAMEVTGARAAFMPRLGAGAGLEFNGATAADQRSSWIVGLDLQINLFRGFADHARIAGARQAQRRAEAEQEAAARKVEIDVRTAAAALDGARARESVGRATLAQAREAQRIIRDRYDSGLATITDILRAAQAVYDAEARAVGAELDVILQFLALERAVGRL